MDHIVCLVDPKTTRFNPWEKQLIKNLHIKYKKKMVYASFVTVEHQALMKNPGNAMKVCPQLSYPCMHTC